MNSFYNKKTVLVTGHTGFKGVWLCKILTMFGAKVIGYALKPDTIENLYELSKIENKMISIIGDIRDYDHLLRVMKKYQPEIVFHLAAQPLVIESYKNPKYTYETNVMGTVNLCECIRNVNSVKSFVNITTDKVYENKEWEWGYRENEHLNGFDPYSNSKSCSDIITQCYIKSFFCNGNIPTSIVRAGNVIGGGDFSDNRIIPDCINAAIKKEIIFVRNPNSIRPYQFVLEPLYVYLLIAEKQYNDSSYSNQYNVGPNELDCISTGNLVDIFCETWKEISWETISKEDYHEANLLKLDCSKVKNRLGWKPKYNISKAIEKVVEFVKLRQSGKCVGEIMELQINEYTNLFKV